MELTIVLLQEKVAQPSGQTTEPENKEMNSVPNLLSNLLPQSGFSGLLHIPTPGVGVLLNKFCHSISYLCIHVSHPT